MTARPPRRWRQILTVVILLVAGLQVMRAFLLPTTHERLAQRYRMQLAELGDEQAARLVERLAADDDQWLEILVVSAVDLRPLVSQAAQRELRNLVHRWADLPAADSSPRAATLALILAQSARDLAPDQRLIANSLARELITWPIDGRAIDAADFIANCQAVLLLPVAEPVEIRLAAVPVQPSEIVRESEPATEPAVEPVPAVIFPPVAVLAPEPVLQPAIAPQAPNEPGRFVPGKSNRISDE
jgi:hypothetical protein